jgi:hypothetical protein
MKKIEEEIVGTILKHSDELLNENWLSISEMLKEVPDGKINVGLAVAIDWSEASPKVKTVISYSRKWKDEREDELDDPNQPRLNLQADLTIPTPSVGGEQASATASPNDSEPPGNTTIPPEPNGGQNGDGKPKRGRKAKESPVE